MMSTAQTTYRRHGLKAPQVKVTNSTIKTRSVHAAAKMNEFTSQSILNVLKYYILKE